jgi:integrase
MFVDFLSRYRAKSTRSMYVSAWVKFLSLVYNARLAGASPEILAPWVAKYVNDLTFLAGTNLPPRPGERGMSSRRQGVPHPPPVEEPLTAGMLLRLLEHLDTRGRAILYVLASSGAGPGDVLSLRIDDLDLEARPARIRIRDREGAVSRVAFISREAVGAIRVYLIVRDRFLASARSRGGRGAGDLLFPLGPRAFGNIWDLALEKAGLGRAGPRAYLEGEQVVTLHRTRGKERMARRVAELERLVRLLGAEARERDRELARIRAVLGEREKDEGRPGSESGIP